MIVAHVFGIPVEETAAQLAPLGGATVAVMCVAGRNKLGRLLTRMRRH